MTSMHLKLNADFTLNPKENFKTVYTAINTTWSPVNFKRVD